MFIFSNKKITTVLCLATFSLSLHPIIAEDKVNQKNAPTESKTMSENYHFFQSEYQKALNILMTKIAHLDKEMEKFKTIQDNLVIDENSGYVKKLEIRAQRYSTELKARKEYSKQIAEIAKLSEKLKNIQFKLSFFNEYYKNLPITKNSANTEVKKANDKKEQYKIQNIDITKDSLFEVLTPAPLKSISALAEVYNDATLWEKIYNANRKYIKDPKGIIPAGTLLLIPHIDKIKNFKNIK